MRYNNKVFYLYSARAGIKLEIVSPKTVHNSVLEQTSLCGYVDPQGEFQVLKRKKNWTALFTVGG